MCDIQKRKTFYEKKDERHNDHEPEQIRLNNSFDEGMLRTVRLEGESEQPVMDQNVQNSLEENYDQFYKAVKKNLPEKYKGATTLLSDESRFFNANSERMKLVKNRIRAIEDQLDMEVEKVYRKEDVEGVLRLYENAINACNAYVNNRKHNERWKKVNGNLLRLAEEAAVWNRAVLLLSTGQISGNASSLRSLMERVKVHMVQHPAVEEENTGLHQETGKTYVQSHAQLFKFKEGSLKGESVKAAEIVIQDIKNDIPHDLSSFDYRTKAYFDLINKWTENYLSSRSSARLAEEADFKGIAFAKEIYRELPNMLQSQNAVLQGLALRLETIMSGTLEVDLNDGRTYDCSYLETNFRENYKGKFKVYDAPVIPVSHKDEPLFAHEPTIEDIKQGTIGDCYLLSSIASLIEHDPKLITESMKDLGDKVAVRFHNFGKPCTVIVEKVTYSSASNGKNIGAFGNALWVKMLEKAFSVVLSGWIPDCDGNQGTEKYSKTQFAHENKGDGKPFGLIRTGNPMNALDCGGQISKFLPVFCNAKAGELKSLTGFHYKAVSISGLAENTRKRIREELRKGGRRPDELQRTLYPYFDRLINAHVEAKFSRTKVKTFSEYMEALASIEEEVKKNAPLFNSFPVAQMNPKQRKTAFLKYIDTLRKYAKTDDRLLHVDHSLIGKDAYNEKELEIFKLLEKAEKEKKVVDIRVRISHKFIRLDEANDRSHAEHSSGGFLSGHSYAFMGVERINENGVNRLFIKLRNPWAHSVRLYDRNATAVLQKNTSVEDEEKPVDTVLNGVNIKATQKHFDTSGMFFMELRDFLNMGESYAIQE